MLTASRCFGLPPLRTWKFLASAEILEFLALRRVPPTGIEATSMCYAEKNERVASIGLFHRSQIDLNVISIDVDVKGNVDWRSPISMKADVWR